MKTKEADKVNGFLKYEDPIKKIEIVAPDQEIYLQFMLHSRVSVRASPTKLKAGKLKEGTRQLVKNYPYKVQIDTGGKHSITLLFSKKDLATVFTWQMFFSNTYKFMFAEKEAVVYEAV